MRKLFEKFFLILYDIFLALAILMLILYLPKELDNLLGIIFFNKYHLLSSIGIIVFLFLGYEAKERQKSEEISNETTKNITEISSTINLVNYLNNYTYSDLKVIQYAYYNGIGKFHIIINNIDLQINDVFIKQDVLFKIDLKKLDECLQNYNDELEVFKVSMYIYNNYKKEINNGN